MTRWSVFLCVIPARLLTRVHYCLRFVFRFALALISQNNHGFCIKAQHSKYVILNLKAPNSYSSLHSYYTLELNKTR